MPRPLIGVTGRRLRSSVLTGMDPRFARTDFDFFFADYARCIHDAGAVAVHLPFEAASLDCVEHLDGLLLSGGQDVHPSLWDGPPLSPDEEADPRLDRVASDRARDAYELDLITAALNRGVAILGTCRGAQILNVALGGTLVPDLPGDKIIHFSDVEAPSDGIHEVEFAEGSMPRGVYGASARVNSWHHQAVAGCAPALRAVGWAPDGVIEAVEMPGRPVLGVQWHPEWHPDPDPVFGWLTRAAQLAT